eukprot:6152479-Prymnesium_polylepis.1
MLQPSGPHLPDAPAAAVPMRKYRARDAICHCVVLILLTACSVLSIDVFSWNPDSPSNKTQVHVLIEEIEDIVEFVSDTASGYELGPLRHPRPRVGVAMSGGGMRAMTGVRR